MRILKQYERAWCSGSGRVRGGARGPGVIVFVPFVDRLAPRLAAHRHDADPVAGDHHPGQRQRRRLRRRLLPGRRRDPLGGGDRERRRGRINQIAQTTLRAVVGRHTLDETLAETETINQNIREILDVQTEEWGMQVTVVELKDIQLPDSMQRAMARQAEAEREKRAKIIAAEGEALAAGELAHASDVMMAHPLALQLRNLQTLVEISVDKNSTVIFPAPLMSTIQELGAFLERESNAAGGSSRPLRLPCGPTARPSATECRTLENDQAPARMRRGRDRRPTESEGLHHPAHAAHVGRAAAARAFSGASATMASVVRMFLAIDAAFCSAERVTIAGSMMPAFDEVDHLARLDVQAPALLGLADLVDDDRALEARVRRRAGAAAPPARAGRCARRWPRRPRASSMSSRRGVQQRHAAARHDALLEGCAGGLQGVLDAVLLLLHLGLGGGADLDHGHAAGELGQALLQLLAIEVGVGVLDLLLDLLDAGLDGVARRRRRR